MTPVYVLVGGESRRFGRNKAEVDVDGEPWALHVGRRLAPGHEPVLVGSPPPCETLDACRYIPDAPESPGPVGGLIAALRDRLTQYGPGELVLASCDLVRPERQWLAPLFDAIDADPDVDAVGYFADGVWQPFPSVAHTRWLDRVIVAALGGVESLQQLADSPRVLSIPWEGTAGGPSQANTPEELAAYTQGAALD
ncbi:NTP transferase domain-containing protein [Botrimarina sp.]|uniref:molybdenum cofactor guanylyltransferase n=1 Tax=Botrimarina sp. TaxID=2795802 RepID=UPI0032EC42B0